MKYVLLLGFCAVIFLICFLIDKLIQKLFPKHELEKSKSVVRPPQKSATFGVLRDADVLSRAHLLPPQIVEVSMRLAQEGAVSPVSPVACANKLDDMERALAGEVGVRGKGDAK